MASKLKIGLWFLLIWTLLSTLLYETYFAKPPEVKERQQQPKKIVKAKGPYSKKLVLLWTTLHGNYANWFLYFGKPLKQRKCAVTNCEFTTDRTRIKESHAIVFHVFHRDFDFLSPTWSSKLPSYRNPSQIWVFFSREPPTHTGRKSMARLNGLFNWTMTYRLDSDIVSDYGHIELLNHTKDSAREVATVMGQLNKTKTAAWLVSHCVTPGRREKYVQDLGKHNFSVDIYGKCGNLSCPRELGPKCLELIAREYKFYVSFENSVCLDYVTEKYTNVMRHPIVPIVFGGAKYGKFAPPGSFVNALDFNGPSALAKYLNMLDRNDRLYEKMIKWRWDNRILIRTTWICDFCKKLHDKMVKKVYWDMDDWWRKSADCKIYRG